MQPDNPLAGTSFDELKSAFLSNQVGCELPRYRCHKEVWALKIKSIVNIPKDQGYDGHVGAMIVPDDPHYGSFGVDLAYIMKHQPQPGGYYVVYKDGYKSFSPAEAFEEGYSRV
jgi:hypothetical protein